MINSSKYINNLSQFIDWTMSLRESEGEPSFPINNIFFRGHASEKWELKAGIFRKENKIVNEHDCFRIASNRCWANVSSFDNLEKLVYFQHFGLLTRLLDVTYNPLVALFFACQEDGEYGQVRYGSCERNDIKTVKIVADVIANYDLDVVSPSKEWLQGLANTYNMKSGEVLGKMLSIPYYIEAPNNSSRIAAQRGAFLMVPLLTQSDDGYHFTKDFDFDEVDEDNMMFGKRNVLIERKNKPQILDELRRVGIDDYSIFPDASHMMSAINKELLWENSLLI